MMEYPIRFAHELPLQYIDNQLYNSPHYGKLLQTGTAAALPPCTTLQANLQHRSFLRTAPLCAYHELNGSGMPIYFHGL